MFKDRIIIFYIFIDIIFIQILINIFYFYIYERELLTYLERISIE